MSLPLAHARHTHRLVLVAAALFALSIALPARALAEVLYLPNVTEEMSDASFWAGKLVEPNTVLASPDEVSTLNQQILADSASCMNDLKNWSQDNYNGIAYGEALRQACQDDAAFFYNVYWARYDQDGTYYKTWDDALANFYTPILDNCVNPNATTSDPLLYGICTTRGYMLGFPTDKRILDDPNDPDFDYQYQTALRVNEAVIVNGFSADGRYYHVISSCSQGWVDQSEIAICSSREQWLDAWDIPSDEVLVVYDDKIQTEDSNYAPQTANVTLPMGTCLRLAAEDELGDILSVTNRSGHNNHVVWMPVRNDDGSYAKQLALIPEHCKVSEGYLPVTASNLISVSLNYLGNAYGWGGMLGSEDCSGYVRDVYRCFGLDLPRNTTWQAAAPVQKYDLKDMSDSDKAALIKTLPPGSTLFFSGHEMTYLGCDGDKLYVISNISSVVLGDTTSTSRIRCCVINTLTDIKRRSGNTWLTSLETATVPFYGSEHEAWSDGGRYLLAEGDGATWKPEDTTEGLSFVVERSENNDSCFGHFTGISVDGVENDGSAYEAQSGSVRLTLKPSYLATLTAGSHNLVFHFDDGDDVAATFYVAEAQTYAITCAAADNGTVSASQSAAIPGASITLTLTPDGNYATKGVTVKDADGATVETTMVNANTYTFTMGSSDVTVQGSFVATDPVVQRYAIGVETAQNGTAGVQKSAAADATVTVTLTPKVGYASQSVTVRDGDGDVLATTTVNENTYTFVMPAQDVTVLAAFAESGDAITYPITTNEAENGTVGTGVSKAAENDVVTITLAPQSGYASKGVSVLTTSGTAVTAQRVNENTYTFVMPAQGVSVGATFAKAQSRSNSSTNGQGSGKGLSSGTGGATSSLGKLMPKMGDIDVAPLAVVLLGGGSCLIGIALYRRRRP